MSTSNEFRGMSPQDVIKRATATYRRAPLVEHKDLCSDLAVRLSDVKREAGRALDRVEALERDADALAEAARRSALVAVVSAATAASGFFGTAARALRAFRSIRTLRELERRDVIALVPVFGGAFLGAVSALDSIKDFREADRLRREAEREMRRADSLGDEIIRLTDDYDRSGCRAVEEPSIF